MNQWAAAECLIYCLILRSGLLGSLLYPSFSVTQVVQLSRQGRGWSFSPSPLTLGSGHWGKLRRWLRHCFPQ